MSIILNFQHFKQHIIMKLNLKAYWREILIGLLIGGLIWVSSSTPKIVRIGSSETICITDTITRMVPGATLLRYQTVKIPVYVHDTNVVNIVTKEIIVDTAWIYADVPLQEYKDTSYYIRTIGWLDSVSVYVPKELPKFDNFKNGKITLPSLYINTQIGQEHFAPGATLHYKKVQVGYNYNLIHATGNVTLGYKIF